jgi:hypothetical protein
LSSNLFFFFCTPQASGVVVEIRSLSEIVAAKRLIGYRLFSALLLKRFQAFST